MSSALRMVALVWFGVVGLTIGAIYVVMWMIYGHSGVMATLDGYGIISYVGLAVILTPAAIIFLASLWMDWRAARGRAGG